jgi:CheY-like chemotaxis protein
MIVIKENAEAKLINALANLRSQPATGDGLACLIHVQLSRMSTAEESISHNQKIIVACAQAANVIPTPQLFMGEDGDIFILMPCVLPTRIKKFMVNLASELPMLDLNAYTALYELNLHRNKLLVLLEEKIDKRRQAKEVLQKKQMAAETEHRRESILNNTIAGPKTHTIAAQRKHRGKAEIMLIEDDPFSRKLVQNVLQRHYSLTALDSAELALSAYAHTAPDVLFLDINLPDVTGHELLEKIIALDPDAYVVMLSGNADKENILCAMSRGAKGFVGKPFSGEKLFQYIKNCPTVRNH